MLDVDKTGYGFVNYLYPEAFDVRDELYSIAIRYPGATRGCIIFNETKVIEKVMIYEDDYHTDDIYPPNVRECLTKYIGMKLILEEAK